ncbi:MAG: GtrA family protein [bacterium]|nr:GtrA family protein [bacterium]
MLKKIDIVLALITGEITALFFYNLLKDLNLKGGENCVLIFTCASINGSSVIDFLGWILAVSFPILTVICLWVSFLLGKKFLWIFQAAKYLLIGVLATIMDLGVLNLLINISGIAAGLYFSVFKGISFIVATCSKYAGDKFWAFEKMEKKGIGKEFGQFFLVTLVGFVINVGVASFVVNNVGPQFGLTPKLWANVGGIVAAFGGMAWNFIGYKFIVFKS